MERFPLVSCVLSPCVRMIVPAVSAEKYTQVYLSVSLIHTD